MNAPETVSIAMTDDARWSAFEQEVTAAREAFTATDPSTNLYALVDTRGLPDLRQALERLASVPFAALWDDTDLDSVKEISPLLIQIGSSDTHRQLLQRLWQFGARDYMVTWIWSPVERGELERHFRTYCEYTLPDQRGFYLHYYDNRILLRLRQTWSDDEWMQFAGVAYEIWYRNGDEQDELWRNEAIIGDVRKTPLTLTEARHLRLLRLGQADKIAMELRALHETELAHLTPRALRRAIGEQIDRATQHRVEHNDDVFAYASMGIRFSPRFDEHPAIQRLLNNILAEPGGFGAALADLPEQIFEDIKHNAI